MYESISIQRFRGLENVTIDRLAKINILVGKNGTGKSTVLEALWLHSNPTQSLVTRVDLFRTFSWDMPGIARTVLHGHGDDYSEPCASRTRSYNTIIAREELRRAISQAKPPDDCCRQHQCHRDGGQDGREQSEAQEPLRDLAAGDCEAQCARAGDCGYEPGASIKAAINCP